MNFILKPDFEALFKAAPGLYLVLTPAFIIAAVSDAYLAATMTKRDDIIGKHLFDVFPDNPNDPKASGVRNLTASLERVIYNRVADTMPVQKYDIRTPNGEFEERYWSPINSPVFNDHNELIYIMHRVEDVTEFRRLKDLEIQQQQLSQELRIKAEKMEGEIFLRTQEAAETSRQLKEANRELVELNEKFKIANKELEAFSYSVSHDLRAPLRAIHGFSRILIQEYAGQLDEEARRLLNIMNDNVQKMGLLIDNLLEFSRLGRKDLRVGDVNMKSIVDAIADELQKANQDRNIHFLIESIEPAQGDQALLRQVWVNLLSNAVKYTKPVAQPVIQISSRQGPQEVIYEVIDNGVGFDMQYVGKLFGVFQRLHQDAEFEGIGVGLAIVHQIIRRHNGKVWAQGRINQGAKFSFSLPKN